MNEGEVDGFEYLTEEMVWRDKTIERVDSRA
jgi:hypothetical protein